MPTYEYECEGCQHSFEEFQSMSDKALRKCPQCGKLKLRRLIGAGAGILDGTTIHIAPGATLDLEIGRAHV